MQSSQLLLMLGEHGVTGSSPVNPSNSRVVAQSVEHVQNVVTDSFILTNSYCI